MGRIQNTMTMNLSRRRFLQSTAASCMASTLPLLAQEPAKARKLRKAVMLGTVRVKTDTLLEKFKAIKEAGFEGVEPNGNMGQQEVIDALKGSGLECASVCCHSHWKDTLTHPDPAIRKKGIEGLLITLRDAKAYGTDSILFVPGTVSAEVTYDVAYQRAQEGIREAIPLAKELGVRISIENVWNNFLLSPLEMARFIDEFDSPWVGAHFDIGNVLRYGWPEQWIKILGKRINRLHFKEFSTEKMQKEGLWKGFEVDFLEGSNNWKEIMTALDGIGYQGWCIAEQRMGINPGDMAKLTEAMGKMFVM
ncbi:sugar phosphate isomerase/epimerase [soil metagenome]